MRPCSDTDVVNLPMYCPVTVVAVCVADDPDSWNHLAPTPCGSSACLSSPWSYRWDPFFFSLSFSLSLFLSFSLSLSLSLYLSLSLCVCVCVSHWYHTSPWPCGRMTVCLSLYPFDFHHSRFSLCTCFISYSTCLPVCHSVGIPRCGRIRFISCYYCALETRPV